MFQRIGRTLWTHKKKTAVGLAIAAYGAKAFQSKLRNDETRLNYAKRALLYGQVTVTPTERLRRVTVLVNREAGERKAAQLFQQNALPLLNLAGLEVNVVEVSSESEMESVAQVLDSKDADCIFVVGGDGTLCRVLTGIAKNEGKQQQRLPIGLFPGGRHNKAFKRILGPKIESTDPVTLCCESAMALIEGEQQRVWPVKCTIAKEQQQPVGSEIPAESDNENNPKSADADDYDDKVYWLLSDLRAGWLEHCDQKEPKLWYWGPLRRRFVYFWEFLKRNPTPLTLQVDYQPFCSGCNRCMPISNQGPAGESGGWFTWIGNVLWPSPSKVNKSESFPSIDYSAIENPDCGKVHESKLSGTDLRVDTEQTQNGSKLRLRVGVGGDEEQAGRWQAMRDGWTNIIEEDEDNKEEKFYRTDIAAGRLTLRFVDIPEFVQKLAVSGDWGNFKQYQDKRVMLETTNPVSGTPHHFYIPKTPRGETETVPSR